MPIRMLILIASALLASVPAAQNLAEPPAGSAPQEPPTVLQPPGSTTLAALFELVRKIDPEARIRGNVAEFRVESRLLILVGDEAAGRMRIMTPIVEADELESAVLHRMLQANFDAVLDSRYAIANGLVWSVFIHPLPPMDEAQFANAVGQVYVAADTFGTTYSSGAFVYGDGDSNEMHERLFEELRKRTEIET